MSSSESESDGEWETTDDETDGADGGQSAREWEAFVQYIRAKQTTDPNGEHNISADVPTHTARQSTSTTTSHYMPLDDDDSEDEEEVEDWPPVLSSGAAEEPTNQSSQHSVPTPQPFVTMSRENTIEMFSEFKQQMFAELSIAFDSAMNTFVDSLFVATDTGDQRYQRQTYGNHSPTTASHSRHNISLPPLYTTPDNQTAQGFESDTDGPTPPKRYKPNSWPDWSNLRSHCRMCGRLWADCRCGRH